MIRGSGVVLRGIFKITAPILKGILYAQVSPLAPFLLPMFVDVFLRMPFLLTMYRTLEVAKDD